MTSYAGLKTHTLAGTGQVTAEWSRLGGGAVFVLLCGTPWQEKGKEIPTLAPEGAGLPLLAVVVVEWVLNHNWYWALKLERPLGQEEMVLRNPHSIIGTSAWARVWQQRLKNSWHQETINKEADFKSCWINKGFLFYIGLAIHFHELLILHV